MSLLAQLIVAIVDSWSAWTEEKKAKVIALCGPLPTPGAVEEAEARIAETERIAGTEKDSKP